jgi:hypothetical protein
LVFLYFPLLFLSSFLSFVNKYLSTDSPLPSHTFRTHAHIHTH